MIYAATTNSSKLLSIIFNYRWLKFTGKISYGLYIFHWIVLTVLEPRIEKWLTTIRTRQQSYSKWNFPVHLFGNKLCY